MKKQTIAFLLVLMLAFVAACSNDDEMPEVGSGLTGRTLTFTASMPDEDDPATRVSANEGANEAISLTWDVNDAFDVLFVQGAVGNEVKKHSTAKVTTIDATGKKATFTVVFPEGVNESKPFNLYGVYGGDGTVSTNNPELIKLPTAGPKLSEENVGKHIMLHFEKKVTNPNNIGTLQFNHVGFLFTAKIKVTNATVDDITGVALVGPGNWAYNTLGNYFNMEDGTFTSNGTATNALSLINAEKDTENNVLIVRNWFPATKTEWPALKLSINDGAAETPNAKPAKEPEAGKAYYIYATWDGVNLQFSDYGEETPPPYGNVEIDKLYGYGEGTTGGQGATDKNKHHFNDGDKFREWLRLREKEKSKEPAIVWLSGTFTKENGRNDSSPWFDIKDTENISIYGTDSFVMQNVGLFIVRSENIIIRNLYIVMPKADNGADGISMQKSSRVWVDHCTFESVSSVKDYEDGSCDITHGTKNVTVSWNHFIKTQKSALIGHSDSETADVAITTTFHHNFFDLSNSRHPRVRFGNVHVYNNFYNEVSTYGVGSAMGAKVLVESNFFDGVHLPTDISTFPAKPKGSSWVSNLNGKIAGFLFEAENAFINKPSNASDPYPFTNVEYIAYNGEKLSTPLTRADFTPPYSYIVDNAEDINTIVPAYAGVGKLPNYDTAPFPIDNGNIPDGEEPGEPGEEPGEGEDGVEIGGGWIAMNIGDASGAHTIAEDGKSVVIEGKGKFESGKQEFYYIYREQVGDFEMTVRLNSFDTVSKSNQGLAGILFTPDVNTTATEFLHALSGKGSKSDTEFNYSHRLASGNASRGVLKAPASDNGSVYLKLKREGDNYFASYSLDGGISYGDERNGSFTALPEKIYVGLAISSGNNQTATKATFSDIKIDGNSLTLSK